MKTQLNLFFALAVLFVLGACGSTEQTTADADATAEEEVTTEETAPETFGAAFEAADIVAYENLALQMTEADSMAVTVQGKVSDVCQKKGCWMNITQESGEEMMVRFKDYGFFMPLDIAGREVIMNGKAFYQTTSVDDLRHYAEDAGKSEEEIAAITEPKRELAFLADGVILLEEE
ncbi:MAG: DUF4920 domain-containing protein [Bacteroidota bacterium]